MRVTFLVDTCLWSTDQERWRKLYNAIEPGGTVLLATSWNPTRAALNLRRVGFERRDTLIHFGKPNLVHPTSLMITTIMFFRKPLEEPTVAKQILKTGSGAINIGGCLVKGIVPVPTKVRNYRRFDNKYDGKDSDGNDYSLQTPPEPKEGRWPPNVLFSHNPTCRKTGKLHYRDIEVDTWTCDASCPVKILNQQSSAAGVIGSKTPDGIIEDGAAERNYPQFTDTRELFDWLFTLAGTPGAPSVHIDNILENSVDSR